MSSSPPNHLLASPPFSPRLSSSSNPTPSPPSSLKKNQLSSAFLKEENIPLTYIHPASSRPLYPASPISPSFPSSYITTPVSPTLPTPKLIECVISIKGMTCSACVASIESNLNRIHGIVHAEIALLSEQGRITFDASILQVSEVIETIENTGFDAQLISTQELAKPHASFNPLSSSSSSSSSSSTAPSSRLFSPTHSLCTNIELDVHGMSDMDHVHTLQTQLKNLPGVMQVSATLSSHRITAQLAHPTTIGIRDIMKCIENLGFTPLVPDPNSQVQLHSLHRTKEILAWKLAFQKSALFAIPNSIIAMLLPMLPTYLQSPFQFLEVSILSGLTLNIFLQLLLTLPVQFGVGQRFYRSTMKSLKHRTATMDTLVALGTSAAFFSSIVAILYAIFLPPHATPVVFFDTCTMLIMFISLGKYLEAVAKSNTSTALTKLISLKPTTALVVRPKVLKSPSTPVQTTQGSSTHSLIPEELEETWIPSELLHVGDTIKVLPGERIPADGVVIQGNSSVDESLVTGESLPVVKQPGHEVVAGTVNGEGFLIFTATKVGSETTLARIVQLVDRAQATKAPIQRWADSIASLFVPIILILALGTLILWLSLTFYFGHFPYASSPMMSEMHGASQADWFICLQLCISVIVVACPCALGLSVPTAVMVGTGVGAQLGILIKSGESLEQMHGLDHIVFDKTGTLTTGQMAVEFTNVTSLATWALIAVAESVSEHPLAKAMIKYAQQLNAITHGYQVNEFTAVPGQGIVAILECSLDVNSSQENSYSHIALGNHQLLNELEISIPIIETEKADAMSNEGHTVIYVALNHMYVGYIAFRDQLKPHVPLLIQHLLQQNIQVSLVTGDSASTAHAIAKLCGISNVYAGISPQHKAKIIQMLQAGEDMDAPNETAIDVHHLSNTSSPSHPKADTDVMVKEMREKHEFEENGLYNHHSKSPKPSLLKRFVNTFDSRHRQSSYEPIWNASQEMGFNSSSVLDSPSSTLPSSSSSLAVKARKPSRPTYFSSSSSSNSRCIVAMVGDGINDAPALVAADIGIALGTGTDIAIDAADLVLMHANVLDVALAIDLATNIFNRIRLNFFWAAFYNLITIPLAMGIGLPWGIMLHPMAAGIAMVFSSVSVVCSSLLLKLYSKPKWIQQAVVSVS